MKWFNAATRSALPILLLSTTLCATSVDAQSTDAPQTSETSFAALEARKNELFNATLNDPTNLDVAFEYAMVSAELGDYEAAISTLERMLVYAPGLPRVQLELAVLYYRIGAVDTAEYYLNEVSQQDLPPSVRARVDEFATLINRQNKPYRFSGTLQAGVQGHTNANLAPNQESIIIGGQPITLDPSATSQSDFNAFALAQIHFTYDLPSQGALLEVDTTLYSTKYADLSRLDMNLIEVAAGPSFSLGRWGWDKARLGVYGILGATTLDGQHYSTTYGGGARLRTQLGERTFLDALLEGRSVDFKNGPNYPTASLQTGDTVRAQAQLTTLVNTNLIALLTFEARLVDGETDFKSYSTYALSARANYYFNGSTAGILADNAPWTLSFAVGGLTRDYDGPDPFIDPTLTQDDDAYWVEASLGVPLEKDFTAYLTGQYLGQNSNYAIRDYEGAVVTFGVSKRF